MMARDDASTSRYGRERDEHLRARTSVDRALASGGIVLAVVVWLLLVVVYPQAAIDNYAYWSVDLAGPCDVPVGQIGAFPYSPLAAQIFALAKIVPFPIFHAAWTAMLLAIILWLLPRRWWPVGVGYAIPELSVGNIHLLIAFALVLALTRTAVWWAIPILTKFTVGVGMLWHLLRREWRSVFVAAGVTSGLAGISFLLAPHLWGEWFAYLAESASREAAVTISGPRLLVPLWLRGGTAVLVLIAAAFSNRRWMVPIAAMMALPVIWVAMSYTVLYAVPRLVSGTGTPLEQSHS